MRKNKILKLFYKIPTIRTERLVLRGLKEEDSSDMFEYAGELPVTEFLLWSPHESEKFTRSYLRSIETRYRLGDFFDWAVTLSDSGKMIGTCGFTSIDFKNNSAEIGYVINPKYHGMGYGFEAASRIVDFGFSELELHRIEAKFMQGNERSLHVMEKLGMEFEGYKKDLMFVKGEYKTIGSCGILRDDYMLKKGKEDQQS